MKRIKGRDLARAIIVSLANHSQDSFCINGFYDYDMEFIYSVANRIGHDNFSWNHLLGAMRRVCRRLEARGVLAGRISSCHAEYIGEPRVLKSYCFSNPSYRWRINPDSAPHYKGEYSPEFEIEWLVEKAYPERLKRFFSNDGTE